MKKNTTMLLDKVSGLVELDGHGFSSAASHGGPRAALIPSGRGRDRDRERGKKIGGDQGVSVAGSGGRGRPRRLWPSRWRSRRPQLATELLRAEGRKTTTLGLGWARPVELGRRLWASGKLLLTVFLLFLQTFVLF